MVCASVIDLISIIIYCNDEKDFYNTKNYFVDSYCYIVVNVQFMTFALIL